MEAFKGPLGSHKNYIAHIALPNAIDYFDLLKTNRELGRCTTPEKYNELRHLLNAAESFNNIPDYIYFDTHPARRKPTQSQFRGALHSAEPELLRVSEMANAYKHCVRGGYRGDEFLERKNTLHARDLAKTEVRFSAGMPVGRPLVEVQYRFEGVDGEGVLGKVFRFWVSYLSEEFTIDVGRVALGESPVLKRAR